MSSTFKKGIIEFAKLNSSDPVKLKMDLYWLDSQTNYTAL